MHQPVMLDVQNWRRVGITASTVMSDKLLLCVSQRQEQATNHKNNGLKDNIRKSIAEQVG